MTHLKLLTDALCIVGESPVYDDINDIIYMVDIQGKRLRKIYLADNRVQDVVLSQQVGFVVLGENGEIIGGAEDGVYLIDKNGKFTKINKPFNMKGARFNDGKIGPDGNLYLGTFSRDFTAAFYKMDCRGNITELFDKVGNSNGLDWSIDGKTMYYNDTPTKKTVAFDFDIERGALTNKRTVFEYKNGNPDGMTIDANGNLWTALWGASKVICINPLRKEEVKSIEFPVSQVSCCAFGGKDFGQMIVTTAAHGVHLKDEELAGAVFTVNVGVKGKRVNRLKLK